MQAHFLGNISEILPIINTDIPEDRISTYYQALLRLDELETEADSLAGTCSPDQPVIMEEVVEILSTPLPTVYTPAAGGRLSGLESSALDDFPADCNDISYCANEDPSYQLKRLIEHGRLKLGDALASELRSNLGNEKKWALDAHDLMANEVGEPVNPMTGEKIRSYPSLDHAYGVVLSDIEKIEDEIDNGNVTQAAELYLDGMAATSPQAASREALYTDAERAATDHRRIQFVKGVGIVAAAAGASAVTASAAVFLGASPEISGVLLAPAAFNTVALAGHDNLVKSERTVPEDVKNWFYEYAFTASMFRFLGVAKGALVGRTLASETAKKGAVNWAKGYLATSAAFATWSPMEGVARQTFEIGKIDNDLLYQTTASPEALLEQQAFLLAIETFGYPINLAARPLEMAARAKYLKKTYVKYLATVKKAEAALLLSSGRNELVLEAGAIGDSLEPPPATTPAAESGTKALKRGKIPNYDSDLARAFERLPDRRAEFLQVVAEMETEGQSVELRRRLHEILAELGLNYAVSRSTITPGNPSRKVAEADRFTAERVQIRQTLVQLFVKCGQMESPLSPASVAEAFLNAVESGDIFELDAITASNFAETLLRGKTLKPGDSRKLRDVFRSAGYEIDLPGDETISVKLAGQAEKKTAAPERTIPDDIMERIQRADPARHWRNVAEDNTDGLVVTRYDEDFRTNIYFTVGPSSAVMEGRISEIPADSKVIVIWFHGSGTENAHGGTFWQDMTALAKYGVASVAFDYPFHGRGPTGLEFFGEGVPVDNFMRYVHRIVTKYREGYPDKKIVLAGHSFGPGVILEYLSRYPNGADGAVLLSPVTRTSERMREHYLAHVFPFLEKRYADGTLGLNAQGSTWAESVTSAYGFMLRPPPRVPIKGIVGEQDQWLPDIASLDPLRKHFPTLDLAIFPDTDHFIFHKTVGEVRDDVAARAFVNRPPNPKTRLIVWSVVDFLHSNFDNIIPDSPASAESYELSDPQRVAFLNEVNPLFRAIAGETAPADTETATAIALAWPKVRDLLIADILTRIPSDFPDFYEANRERVDGLLAKGVTKDEIPKSIRGEARTVFQKLQSHLSEAEKRRDAATKLTFGTKARAADGNTGENYWSRSLQETASAAIIKYQKKDHPTTQAEPVTWIGRRWRRFTDSFPRRVSDVYASTERARRRRDSYLGALRDTMNVRAETVLKIGSTSLETIRLFDGTRRLIFLSRRPFGSPAQIGGKIDADMMEKTHAPRDGYSLTDHLAGTEGTGAAFIAHIMMELGAHKTNPTVHYFRIEPDGRKTYINPDMATTSPEEFANAEIQFKDVDGSIKTVEVIRDDELSPSEPVRAYLNGTGIGAIFAGTDATDLETRPEGLAFYLDMLSRSKMPFVTGVRRSGNFRGHMQSYRPFSFLNGDSVQIHDIGQINSAFGNTLFGGERLYVARDSDFLPTWKYGSTQAYEQNWYTTMLNEARMGDGVPSGVLPEGGDRIISIPLATGSESQE